MTPIDISTPRSQRKAHRGGFPDIPITGQAVKRSRLLLGEDMEKSPFRASTALFAISVGALPAAAFAQKRSENLRQAPLAISVLSGAF